MPCMWPRQIPNETWIQQSPPLSALYRKDILPGRLVSAALAVQGLDQHP